MTSVNGPYMRVETRHEELASGLGPRQLRFAIYGILLCADILALVLGSSVASIWRDTSWLSAEGINLWLASTPIFVAMAFSRNAYSIGVFRSPMKGLRAVIYSFIFSSFCVLFAVFSMQKGEDLSRAALLVAGCSSFFLLVSFRCILGVFVKSLPQDAYLSRIVICDGDWQQGLRNAMPDFGDDNDQPHAIFVDAQQLGLLPDLNNPTMLHRFGTLVRSYDRVYVYSPSENRANWSLIMKGAGVEGEILYPQFNELGAIGISQFNGNDTLVVSCGPLNIGNRMTKRALDLFIAIPLMMLLTIPLIVIAIAIKIDSAGPIFFVQERMGRGNRLFHMYKFRSMRTDQTDLTGNRSASRDDDRVTRVGKILRATSIDELPQLINVIKGDMSLVGPRPHALGSTAEEKLFWEIDSGYWRRHALKPGITGLAQVRGHRGATHSREDLEKRLGADLEYLSDWNVWKDVGILFATAKVVIHRNAF